MKTRIWTTYGLADPESGEVRYVGCTMNLECRISAHGEPAKKTPVSKWVRELLTIGHKPIVLVLFEGRRSEALKHEAENVEKYRALHCDRFLVLSPRGRGGGARQWTDESRAKLSRSSRGKKKPNTSATMKGQLKTPEHRANMSKAKRKQVAEYLASHGHGMRAPVEVKAQCLACAARGLPK